MRNPSLSLQLVTGSRWTEIVSMTVGLIATTALLHQGVTRHRVPSWAAGLIVGGAVSNLLDRLLLGSVRDVLVVDHLAVVNLADLAVLIGLLVAVVSAWPGSVSLADRASSLNDGPRGVRRRAPAHRTPPVAGDEPVRRWRSHSGRL